LAVSPHTDRHGLSVAFVGKIRERTNFTPLSGGIMMPESNTETPAPDDEVHIRLNLAGLAALMGTIEQAMAHGRSELRLGWSGVTVTGGGSEGLRTLTLTWRPDDGDGDGELEPDPMPQSRVLETLS
jgi:hypothetical protein